MRPVEHPVQTAERIILGHCPNPECSPPFGGRAIAVFNNHESWPPVRCECGWAGSTTELINGYRLDRGWRVSDGHGPERELRP